jgi:geranylgeranyl pyrophosphate synthase
VTLAPIRALQVLPGGLAQLVSGDCARVCDLLRRTGALDYAMHAARAQVYEAKAALQSLPPSEAREELSELADFAVQRCR